jgi:glycine/D-amino acid oxidase-like deaminating enzyme
MGASVAYFLTELGGRVLIVDRSAPGSEASAATAGTLAVQNKHLPAIPLVLRALDLWKGLSDRLGSEVEYERRGGFRVAHSDADVAKLEEGVRAQKALGVPVEMVYPPELRREAPYLSSGISAASYCPLDGMVNPFATTRALLRAARRRGALLWGNCPVERIEVRSDEEFLVHTARGAVRCNGVVLAAGAWNRDLAAGAGFNLPLNADVLQVVITDFGPPLFPHIVTHVRGNLTVKQQRATGKILIGGAWRGEGDPATGVKRVRRESLVGNLKWATETIPGIARTRLLRAWVGFEGRTPDKLLISGSLGPRNLHILGCAAGGFTLSVIAGKLAAEALVRGETEIGREFGVERFLGGSPHPETLAKESS